MERRYPWSTITVETSLGEILRWRLLLFHISKESVGNHQATWDEKEQVLTYDDTELRMDEVPTLLASEYRDCQRLLYGDLMLGLQDLRRVHALSLKDIGDVDVLGWSFVQHRDNAHLLQGTDQSLLSAIEPSEHLCRIFLAENHRASSGVVWRQDAVAAYEATVQDFLRRLCVLIHISGGQPIWESEFFSMTWRNTQRRRSITLRHDRIMIHVKYHKGQQQTGQ
ncbi:hypothetical protein LTR87_016635 [Friedmanniomyces endolithicus]|nr:hypothetical protein LTR87_016635 [Friedmanniomyces endolithicus]